MTWHFGILADRAGRVHLGAVVAGSVFRSREYIELLAPVGAAPPAEHDLEHLVVLVHGRDIADLRRLVEQCIDHDRLRRQLTELIDLSAPVGTERGMGRLSPATTVHHRREAAPMRTCLRTWWRRFRACAPTPVAICTTFAVDWELEAQSCPRILVRVSMANDVEQCVQAWQTGNDSLRSVPQVARIGVAEP